MIYAYADPQSRADVQSLAALTKHCVISLTRPRPLAEAISSAGGVCWSEVDASLMLKKLPGVFVAGEMLDWEAPTGGYLIQGCLATGTRAGAGATAWVGRTSDRVYSDTTPMRRNLS
ncbi:MAG: NAD(P)/FAD-dependent oxidoreductase [Chthoniobacterales bacterium]